MLSEARWAYNEVARMDATQVDRWYMDNIERRPWTVAVIGKTKADYISVKKFEATKLRFYNVLPRPMVMVMQTVTQKLEDIAENCFDFPNVRSAQGISLDRGGANRLIGALVDGLDYDADYSYTYLHCGDDSLVAWFDSDRVCHLFTVDCTAFDLTQRSDITEPVHEEMYDILSMIHVGPARLWYNYMRQRLVVLNAGKTYLMKNGGPSGTPLQSKVNDVLMDIYLNRLGEFLSGKQGSVLESAVARIGKSMGFEVRLEQHVTGESIRACIRKEPILFIGYRIWFDEEGQFYYPYVDIHRSLAQRPCPSTRWETKDHVVLQREAMRIASIVAASGKPPPELDRAHNAQRRHAIQLLQATLDAHGDVKDRSLAWYVHGLEDLLKNDPTVADEVPSMSGLLRFMLGGWDADMWEPDVWSTRGRIKGRMSQKTYDNMTQQLTSLRPLSWADEVEEVVQAESAADKQYVAAPLPPPAQPVAKQPIMAPPTAENFGKMPARLKEAPPPKIPLVGGDQAPKKSKKKARRNAKRTGVDQLHHGDDFQLYGQAADEPEVGTGQSDDDWAGQY